VLDHKAVQLVGQDIDRGIHGLTASLGVQGLAGDVGTGIHVVFVLAQLQGDPHLAVLVEVLAQALQLGFHVLVQGRGDFYVFAKRLDAHRVSPLFG